MRFRNLLQLMADGSPAAPGVPGGMPDSPAADQAATEAGLSRCRRVAGFRLPAYPDPDDWDWSARLLRCTRNNRLREVGTHESGDTLTSAA